MNLYQNPLHFPEETVHDLGDPFVMRFNGRYYLFPSTGNRQPGVHAWVSEDMVNWEYGGNVAPDPGLVSAYAPEVFYYNGCFYLVTSPNGEGHFLYRSREVLGPYAKVGDHLGLTIDGSLFADDDGSLYFFHAEYPCIHGHAMDTEGNMGPVVKLAATSMGHWTEGPGVFKRRGKYYITMTGNHLLSRGYRVDYAISDEGPLGPYRVPHRKTLLVNTDYARGSLGHSSTVLGPDLDSHWIFYHNFPVSPRGKREPRTSNLDRLVFCGESLYAVGPTNMPCPGPKRADFAAWADELRCQEDFYFHQDLVLSRQGMGERGTAEVTLRFGERGSVVFGYEGPQAYDAVSLEDGALVLRRHGAERLRKPVFAGFDPQAWHTLRLERNGERLAVLLDGMGQFEAEYPFSTKGQVGTAGAKATSFISFSEEVDQSSDRKADFAIPGRLFGVLHQPGEEEIPCLGGPQRPYALVGTGRNLRFGVNVEKEGVYCVKAMVHAGEGALCILRHREESMGAEIPGTQRPQLLELGPIVLKAGLSALCLEVNRGAMALEYLELFPIPKPLRGSYRGIEVCDQADLMEGDAGIRRWEGIQMDRPGQVLARFGQRYHRDETVETEMIFRGDQREKPAGIFLRVSENSVYPDQVMVGHRGYFVGFDGENVQLWRMDFGRTVLCERYCPLETQRPYTIKARIGGNALKVWVDGREVLAFEEDEPWSYGLAGVGSFGSRVTFSAVAIDLK